MGIVVFESIQNGGYNGGNGLDNMEHLEEMGKDCYRGDLFINISKFAMIVCLIVVFESIQNGGYNGGNGLDNMEHIEEMGKDCYRGDLFINISKFAMFVCLID